MEIGIGKSKIVKLTKNKDQLFSEEEMSLPIQISWPLGTQGALTILNGEVLQISVGSTLDYSSIDIQAGGVLEIVANLEASVTYIGCTGNINIDGELRARNYLGTTQPILGSANGATIAYTLTQVNGGNGGRTFTPEGWWANSPTPGIGGNGFGAGGAGGQGGNSQNWVGAVGQAGGSNNGPGNSSPGRAGGTGGVTLGNGGNGGNAPAANAGGLGGPGGGSGGGAGSWVFGYNEAAGGGGGGGGYKGRHGLPVFIYCLGSVTGTGIINLSGSNGFAGGNGGNAFVNNYNGSAPRGAGGAGGGGGAGGSGGYLLVRYGGSFSVPYTTSAGIGGIAGTGGQGKRGSPSVPSGGINVSPTNDSQTAGQNGITGLVDIAKIL